jgi:hypothetical protein
MAWTEESIVAEFRTHLAYWQAKLRLRDVEFIVVIHDTFADDPDAWVSVRRGNCEANPYAVDLRIRRGSWEQQTSFDVWSTTAHECVHVMNWAMAYAFEPLTDHLSISQMNMAKKLIRAGNEHLAYKWESILVEFFKADAPPNTIPVTTDTPVSEP